MFVLKERLLTRLSANRNQGKQRYVFNYLYNNRQETHASHFGIDGVTNSYSELFVIHYFSQLASKNYYFSRGSINVVQCISITYDSALCRYFGVS